MPLTDTAIRKAKAADKTQRFFDGGGLYLELTPNGARYWRLKYRHGGKEKRLALGVYPTVALAAARELREQAKATLSAGRDPSVEKRTEKLRAAVVQGNTFRALGDDWLAVRASGWTPLQLTKERGRLENHAYPWVGDLPIAEVGVGEIRPLLDRLVKAGHLAQAHRLREQRAGYSAMRWQTARRLAIPPMTCATRFRSACTGASRPSPIRTKLPSS
jgi:hypothetical protein